MRRRVALLATVAAVLAAVSGFTSQSQATTPSVMSGALLFHDSFSGKVGALPTAGGYTDYSACTYNGSAAFGDIQCGNNETTDGKGDLQIPATPTTGSGIRVASKYAYEYGVFSAWVKAPPQDGYWPAFWTLNNGYTGTNNPQLGEADAYEGYTHWPTSYWGTEHNWMNDGTPSGGSGTECSAASSVNLSAAFHIYSVEIAPNAVSFYIDGTQCGPTVTPQTNPDEKWGFGPAVTSPNWMILDLAVGGAGGQQPTPTSNATMLVSRIEVRQLP